MLIVGDPGLGKSQMLQAIANVAPRSVYVCGSTTTTTGLTVTLSKESGTGNYSLEAGALVLADRGIYVVQVFFLKVVKIEQNIYCPVQNQKHFKLNYFSIS